MVTTDLGEVQLSELDILQGLYSGQIDSLSGISINDPGLANQYNLSKNTNKDDIANLNVFTQSTDSKDIFDKNHQSTWFMPEYYKNFDIEEFLVLQCKTDVELDRVAEELILFRQFNMIDVLKYIKYLVDTMRQNNIVWGVGRGSSTASYCLFLMGLHKIDSIKFELDINEFLK